ncbi:MAG: pyrrolidone-carboxylate peptidase [Candidatus Eremiobacteraeota bacterium]|nr:pyrrolidone-carboxylate peptidase [Candidatus Eremiobacteraeota bacterium]
MQNGAGRRVLVTGFERFGGDQTNPSEHIVRTLSGRRVGDCEIVGALLPVDAGRVMDVLLGALAAAGSPVAVICTGLAPGRTGLALERIAVNLLDFEIPDNAGNQVHSHPVSQDGEAARFTKLPVDRILAGWREARIPGYVSDSAGTFLCNQVFYEVLALSNRSYPAGFIHVPASPELAIARGADKMPSMSLDLMVRGIEIAVAATVAAARTEAAAR